MGKQTAYGTRLRYIDPQTAVDSKIFFVADITGPEISVETIDVTNHDSPDAFNEFIPGIADGGEVGFDLIFDPDTTRHWRILDLVDLRLPAVFTIFLPRPDTSFLTDPEFTVVTPWTRTGAWTITGGQARYTAATPNGTDLLSVALAGLSIGESYKVSIVVATGAGICNVKLGAVVVASFECVAGQAATVRFTATAAGAALAFIIPAGGGATTVNFESIQVTGFSDDGKNQFEFSGLFTKMGVAMPVKDALKASASIKVIGVPAFTGPV